MILRIARRELLELYRDGRFRAAAAAVLLLLAAALAAGWHATRELRAQHAAATELTREHWLNQGPKNPHSAAHYGIYAFKPKPVLALVDEGVDPYVGVAVYLEAHRQNEFSDRPAADATSLQRYGALTAATVLQVMVPLLILLVGFRTFVGERELGTLRQVLSLGLAPRALALGKATGLALGLAALLIPAALLGSIAILGAGAGTLDSRAVLLALAYLSYFAAWLGLTLAISARASSSRTALLTLLGIWIVATLFAPRGVTEVVRVVHPTPTAQAFQEALRQEIETGPDGTSSPAERAAALRARVLAEYGVDSLSQLPVNFSGLSLQESERWGDAAFDRHFGALWDTYERQERLRTTAGLVIPVLGIRSLSMALAGTDVRQHRHFTESAERYRRHLVEAMNHDLAIHGVGHQVPYLADATLWASVPPFAYEPLRLRDIMAYRGWVLAALLVWALGSLAWAIRSARHLRPEHAR